MSAVAQIDPPVNIEVEQALLGAILVNNEAFDRVANFLTTDHFSEELHRRVFETMGRLFQEGKKATPALLMTYLGDHELAPGLKTSTYVARLAAEATSVSNAADYGQTILDLSIRRTLIDRAQAVIAAAATGDMMLSALTLIEEHESELSALRNGLTTAASPIISAETALDRVVSRMAARGRGEVTPAATSGFIQLDDKIGGGFRDGRLIVMAGRPGMGKAQPLHAKIKTLTGWTTFAEVKVGDRLASTDGAASTVVGVYPQGKKPTFRMTLSDGRAAECCAEHLWEVNYRGWESPRIIETSRIAEMLSCQRYRGRLSIRRATGYFGDTADLPVDPYVVGALLGDGCLLYRTPRFSSADPEVLDRLAARLPYPVKPVSAGGVDYYLTTSRRGPRCNPLADRLRALSIDGVRSENKRIPERYKLADRVSRIELIRGLMDTDGWVERHGTARFSSSSEGLALDFVDVARSLGYWAKVSRRRAIAVKGDERREGLPSFVVTVSGPGIEEIVTLPRKVALLDGRAWFRDTTVKSVEPVGEAECACIAVSHPSRLYITDDYVVTHNTVFNIASARRTAKKGNGVGIFSMEIDAEEIGARLIASHYGKDVVPIHYSSILSGKLKDEDQERVALAEGDLRDYPIEIDCTPGLSIAAIESRARTMDARLRRKGFSLQVLYIDYLQLVAASDRYRGRRVDEVGEIALAAKNIAKRLGCAVVLFSQLNRSVEAREDKRPTMADVRDSGNIEEHADAIALLYRPAYYDQKTLRLIERGVNVKVEAGFEDLAYARRYDLEIILDKNRLGPQDTVLLACDPARSMVDSGRDIR